MNDFHNDKEFLTRLKGATGKIVVIVAPSGTGKSTLIKRLREALPQLKESVSFTSRPKRQGEIHGKNYFFISEEEFKQQIKEQQFLEWALVHSNFYGTSKAFVEKTLHAGETLLFDLDVQGADSFKRFFQDKAFIIFIEPPSVDELSKRLYERATETEEVIQERLKNAKKELERKKDFDALVMNDQQDLALKKLIQLVEPHIIKKP
jgi:guanylate kinase